MKGCKVMFIRLKSPAEIEKFNEAGKIAGEILGILLKAAVPKVTTAELDSIARRECGARAVKPAFLGYRGFPAAICTSINNELVHGVPSEHRVLENGDLLTIDIGVDIGGFIGDTADTILVGSDDGSSKIATDCRSALYGAIDAMRPSGRLSVVGEVIGKAAKDRGYFAVTEYGGHGVNKGQLHADPFVYNRRMIGSEEDVELYPGMVIAIEPMFIEGGISTKTTVESNEWTVMAEGLCAHCEHTVAVTKEGIIILTKREEV
jgi:methionyl aminopeptidase